MKAKAPTPLEWTDVDGDKGKLGADPDDIGEEPVLATISIFDSETGGQENAVYVDEEDARRIIAWLTERLSHV
jgi:hypothetical protein